MSTSEVCCRSKQVIKTMIIFDRTRKACVNKNTSTTLRSCQCSLFCFMCPYNIFSMVHMIILVMFGDWHGALKSEYIPVKCNMRPHQPVQNNVCTQQLKPHKPNQ